MFVINLDKERHAKVTNKALKLFKEKSGKDLLKAGCAMDMEDCEVLLWACLLKEDPNLTLEQVQDEVELFQIRQFTSYIIEGSVNPT